jgi:hypothetical protein
MLKALLHRKLGRAAAEQEEGVQAAGGPWEGITRLEDPLTSAVFERIAYLEPRSAWELLRGACAPADGDAPLPEAAPEATPLWSFWPMLRVGEQGGNTRYVQPDVLLSWGDVVLVIEAKHCTVQVAAQWIEEIRAVRSDASFAGKRVWLVAVGGMAPGGAAGHAADVRRVLGDRAPALLVLRWEDLGETVRSARQRALSAGEAAILGDIAAALEEWGYRRRVSFVSLPELAHRFPVETSPSALRAWRVR